MIARSRPGYDPNPLAVRDAFYSHLSTLPKAPFDSAQNYDGSEEQPLTAYDSDVGFIATALTRLAIDTALSRDPSVFPYSLYLLGMRCEWILSNLLTRIQSMCLELDGIPMTQASVRRIV